MKHLDLFSGIAGFALAAEAAGFETIAFCEIEPEAALVFAAQFPGVPNLIDVSKIDYEQFRKSFGVPDLLTAGVPCQPASLLGKRGGTSDKRWLWPDTLRAVRELRPRFCVFENPPAILTLESGRPFNGIIGELSALGYVGFYDILPAAAVGAGHLRERLFIVAANADSILSQERTGLCEGESDGQRRGRFKNKAGKNTTEFVANGGSQSRQPEREGASGIPEQGKATIAKPESEVMQRINLLPTVTARDWKDSPGMATEVVKAGNVDRTRLDQLPHRLFADLKATTGLKLNPRWCLWFMGYPLDWLKPLYDAWETRSSRKSRKSSSKQSETK